MVRLVAKTCRNALVIKNWCSWLIINLFIEQNKHRSEEQDVLRSYIDSSQPWNNVRVPRVPAAHSLGTTALARVNFNYLMRLVIRGGCSWIYVFLSFSFWVTGTGPLLETSCSLLNNRRRTQKGNLHEYLLISFSEYMSWGTEGRGKNRCHRSVVDHTIRRHIYVCSPIISDRNFKRTFDNVL